MGRGEDNFESIIDKGSVMLCTPGFPYHEKHDTNCYVHKAGHQMAWIPTHDLLQPSSLYTLQKVCHQSTAVTINPYEAPLMLLTIRLIAEHFQKSLLECSQEKLSDECYFLIRALVANLPPGGLFGAGVGGRYRNIGYMHDSCFFSFSLVLPPGEVVLSIRNKGIMEFKYWRT